MNSISKLFFVFGIILIFLGILWQFKIPIGRLPGDIFIDRGNLKFYIPLGTSLLISLLLGLFWMLIMFWKK